jgi:LuxR family maltose regulon positive regulatory protein
LLEQLEASNIFLFPLDSRREWYRYHRLFAEFLKARLSPAEETALQRRAAAWYESHRMPFLAVRHALDAGALSGDYAEAARLIRAAAEEGIREGRSQTLLDWMRSLPGKMLSTDPELMLYKGWALTLTGGFPEAVVLAAQAEQAAAAGAGGRSVRGKIALLQAFLALMQRGDLPETVRRAERAIEDLQAGGEQWLPMAHWLLAEPYERMGQLEQAIRTLKESRKVLPATLSHLFTDLVDIMLVYDLNLAGKRREALEICRETLRRRDSTEEGSSPTSCMLLARQAMLHYEADELNRARELYGQAVEYGRRHRQEPFVTFARGTCAQLLLALGKTNDAAEALDQAVDAARQSGLTDLGTVLAARANFRLQLGDEDSVRRWIEEAGCSDDEEPQYLRLDTQLVYVRWLLRRGSLDRAGQTLSRLRAFLEPAGIRRPLITVRILSALLADRRGDRPSAVDHLAAAVRLASPEDYLRVFLEEEPRTLSLLPAVRDADPPFIDRLLSAAARTPAAVDLSAPPGPLPAGPRSGGEDVLAEPLSVREIEILRLLAKGLSNSQIAERLVIALATVKRHVQNIYGKLGVNSRTQAVAEGRRRKLVE